MSLLGLEGFVYLMRWLHYFFGVIWIGLLYYFNFVQGSFFAETDANTKSAAIQKLVPRALWWFRWGAMGTFVTGLTILSIRGHQGGFQMFASSWGVSILTGVAMGTIMWANVWFVIWPSQQIVIKSAQETAAGRAALPEAPGAALRAGVASRTNTMLSIPMLFFMGAASHLPLAVTTASLWPLVFVIAAVLGAIEFNALKGKTGPMTTVKGVIGCGFGVCAGLYIIIEILTKI